MDDEIIEIIEDDELEEIEVFSDEELVGISKEYVDNADQLLAQQIADEAAARQNADSAINAAHSNEVTARQLADDNINIELAKRVLKKAGWDLSEVNFSQEKDDKLAGLEGPKYKGRFLSEDDLNAVVGIREDGAYAYVDAGIGVDAIEYIYDFTDDKWIKSQSAGTAETPATILTKYESNPDRKGFTVALFNKLVAFTANFTTELEVKINTAWNWVNANGGNVLTDIVNLKTAILLKFDANKVVLFPEQVYTPTVAGFTGTADNKWYGQKVNGVMNMFIVLNYPTNATLSTLEVQLPPGAPSPIMFSNIENTTGVFMYMVNGAFSRPAASNQRPFTSGWMITKGPGYAPVIYLSATANLMSTVTIFCSYPCSATSIIPSFTPEIKAIGMGEYSTVYVKKDGTAYQTTGSDSGYSLSTLAVSGIADADGGQYNSLLRSNSGVVSSVLGGSGTVVSYPKDFDNNDFTCENAQGLYKNVIALKAGVVRAVLSGKLPHANFLINLPPGIAVTFLGLNPE